MRALMGLLLIVVLGGCSAAGFAPKGAGQNVYSEDIARESALQETYAGILCRDNGLPSITAASGAPICDYSRMQPGHWSIFVNAGLYDIDRRCDGYLEWLYEVRRLRGPINTQLGKTTNLATTLLRAFDAANLTIEVVGLAFGYAQDTFANFDPNLLWGVESSTIQTLVLNRQLRAKEQIRGLRFSNKPEALHALRGYLRICMPFTIETDINTTLSSGARGITTEPVIEVNSAATGADALSASRQVTIVDQPALPEGPSEAVLSMFASPSGKTNADVEQVQRYLCDPNPGGFGDTSRRLIHVVEDNPGVEGYVANGKLDTVEYGYVLQFGGPCDTSLYRNSYERQFLGDADEYAGVVEDINRLLPDNPLPEGPYSAAVQQQLRGKLRTLRTNPQVFDDKLVPEDQLSRSVWNSIRQLARNT